MPQIFPKWSNRFARLLPIGALFGLGIVVFVFYYYFSPWNLNVGYRPEQPIPFSHKLHSDNLKIDCLYCHFNAEKSPHAGVPSTQTCMNCHDQQSNKEFIKLAGLMKSWQGGSKEGLPIPWVKVHKLADYCYFDHSAHIKSGVSCISCHGDVSQMEQVRQEKPLSMAFCLDCHRNPAKHLRPADQVTNMKYQQDENFRRMAIEKAKNMKAPVEDCTGCHR